MIIFHLGFALEEVAIVAELFRGLADQRDQPVCGAGIAQNIQILVADHVGQHEGLNAAQGSVFAPASGQVAAAIGGVGAGPGMDGFFSVEKDQPHRVAVEGLAAQLVGYGHEQAGGRSAVVGAHKVDVLKPVVGFVVGGQHDDAVLLAGEAHDEVAHGHRPDGRVGGERILFELVVLELVAQELFGLQVAGAGGPARANGYKLACVLKSFGAIEVGLSGSGQWSQKYDSRCRLFPERNQTHCPASLAFLALRREGCTHQATPMPIM